MANSINVNGCSVCQPGRENYTSFTAKIGRKTVKRWQYDYRTESGELFSCVGESLDNCRAKSYTVKAKTAAEARRKAWEKFKRRPPKSCFTLMEDRIDE